VKLKPAIVMAAAAAAVALHSLSLSPHYNPLKALLARLNFLLFISYLLLNGMQRSLSANDIINIVDTDTTQPPAWQNTNQGLPYFDNTTRRDITATVGSAAKLHCTVRNLGDRAVSK
jgi:hypothetical protein